MRKKSPQRCAGRGVNGGIDRAGHVVTVMLGTLLVDRVDPRSEAAGRPVIIDRKAQRQGVQQPLKRLPARHVVVEQNHGFVEFLASIRANGCGDKGSALADSVTLDSAQQFVDI